MKSTELHVVSSRSYTLTGDGLVEIQTEEKDGIDVERISLVLPKPVAQQIKQITSDQKPLAIMLWVALARDEAA